MITTTLSPRAQSSDGAPLRQSAYSIVKLVLPIFGTRAALGRHLAHALGEKNYLKIFGPGRT